MTISTAAQRQERFRPPVKTRRRLRGLAAATVICLAAAPSFGQTLTEAMRRAYEHHPALSAQRANVRALTEDIDRARAGWRPSLSVSLGTGRRSNSYKIEGGPVNSYDLNTSEVRLTASQPLLNWTTGPQVEAAEARMQQGRADLLDTEQKVMLEVATAYLHVLQYRELLKLHEENVRSLARQVAYRQEHYERKLGTLTELAQARARHAGAVAQRDRVKAELEIATSAFIRHVGAPPGKLSYPQGLPPLPDSLEMILEDAAQARPAVRSAWLGLQAAQADAEAAEGQLKPALSLDASGSWTHRPEQGMYSRRDAAVQLTLRIPLYQGGADRAQVRSSKERVAQQQSLWRDSSLQARQEAADAWRRLQTARQEIEAFSAAVEANRVAYSGVEAEYAALGELTLIEVLNARQELFSAEISLVQARIQETLSHLQLLAAQGRLTARDMGLSE
jgi:outer membrane protein